MSTPPRRQKHLSRSPDRFEKPIDLRPLVRLKNVDTSRYVLDQCSQRDLEIFTIIFQMINTKEDGIITPLQIRKALVNIGGYNAGRKQIYKIMSCWDLDLSGEISIVQFIRMMTHKLCLEKDTVEEISKTFDEIDKDKKGYIDYDDLYDLAANLGEELSQEELDEIMRKCDPTRQGRITKQAFIQFNKKAQF